NNADNTTLQNLDLSNPNPAFGGDSGVSVEAGSDNANIQNVTTTGASSFGIQVFNSANPTIQNNTLNGGFNSQTAALALDTVAGLAAGAVSGNTFANSGIGLKVWNVSGITIGDAGVAGAQVVLADGISGLGTTSTALYLRNLDNSTIDNLDLAWT